MRERARRARESEAAGLRKGKYPCCTQQMRHCTPTVFYSLRHVRFSSGTLTFPILCIVHAIVKCVSILRSFFTHRLDPCCLVRKTKGQFTSMASNLHLNFV